MADNWGPTYQGWTVTVLGTAHVMANNPEEARSKVLKGLRKQQAVLFLTVEADGTQPCVDTPPEVEARELEMAEREANETVGGYLLSRLAEGEARDGGDVPVKKLPKRRFCPVHKADLQSPDPCTPGFVGCTHKAHKA